MPSPTLDETRGGRRPTPVRSPEATQLLRLLVVTAVGALGSLLGAITPATLEGFFSGAGAPNSPSAGPTAAGGAASAGAGGGAGGGSGGGGDDAGGSGPGGGGDDEGEGGPDDDGIGDDPPPGTRSPTDPDYGPLDRLLDAIVSALGAIPGLGTPLPLLQGAPMAAEGIKNYREGNARRREALDVVQQERDLRTNFQEPDQ